MISNKNTTTVGLQTKMEFKKHKLLWISLIVLVVLILAFASFKYIQSTKRKSYLQGGNDAINQIITLAKESGGITLKENDNSTLALALYQKEVTEDMVEEIPLEDSTTENSTETDSPI